MAKATKPVASEREMVLDQVEKHVGYLWKKAKELKEHGSAEEIARFYAVEVRSFYDAIDGLLAPLKELKDKMAYEWIPESFEANGVTSITLKDWRVTTQGLVRASTRDMAKGIAWMQTNGYEHIPKLTINASTLAALARQLKEEKNKELPADLFNVHFGSNTSVTRV